MSYKKQNLLKDIERDKIIKAAEFAEKIIKPNAQEWESAKTQPVESLRQAIRQFAGINIPAELGGEGLSFSTLLRCYEELAARDLGFTCALAVHCVVAAATAKIIDTELRSNNVSALISGESIGAFVLTEPDAGSDAGSIKSHAERKNGGFCLTGHKAWVTNGSNADFLLTFCQTDTTKGAKGIACFALERSQRGMNFSAPIRMLASHAMGTTNLQLDKVEASQQQLAFPPGIAFSTAMAGLNIARIGVAAMCNGALLGGLKAAIKYATERHAFGQSIYNFQKIQFALAEIATQLEASRSLTFQAAHQLDSGIDSTLFAAHAKKFATQTAFKGLSDCLQVFGANGLKDEYDIHRQMSAARVCEFMDGTSEIQNLVIARALKSS
ncbi:acyl-CoA dehydrogenase family protein [Alcaligenes sp. 13f]|uniref:acyl-CoA dehydrogenase family protein n=1 Tax=Alcaligenes sp. 13f TaxID=2841924 RepID=UPI001CF71833|nr:acyl-CoA dehydrogenase family protein [Alcaligenes sp. 13f]MCB4321557.1 acyl-CoA dehydrogenase family protein [Alcaligenes sp. 13f]